jgi:hypothetical protein
MSRGLVGIREVGIHKLNGARVSVLFDLSIDTQMCPSLEGLRSEDLLETIIRDVMNVAVAVVSRVTGRRNKDRLLAAFRHRKSLSKIEDDKAAWLWGKLWIKRIDVATDAI